jgi:type IV pilus assembly protein PilC
LYKLQLWGIKRLAKEKFKLNEITIGGVNQKELTQFTRQFATLQNAGLNTLRSLDLLMNMLKPGVLKNSVKKVRSDVEQGTSLSNAMARCPKAFDGLYVNMIRAGEAGGILDSILVRLADFREKSQKMAAEIKAALIYPISVVLIAGSIVTAIIIFIVPNFQKMFVDMKMELPAMTMILLDVSDLVQNEYYKPISAVVGFFVLIKIISSFPKGRYWVDFAKMYVPVFGQIIRKSGISRFCRTMGTLIDSGVPLVEALTILRGAAGNEALGAVIDQLIVSVKQGDPLTTPLRKSALFDEMTVSMLEVGDEAGEVSQMMIKVADNFDTEVDTMVTGMKSLIEPFLIVGLGGVVGFIVIALFMPLLSLMSNLG